MLVLISGISPSCFPNWEQARFIAENRLSHVSALHAAVAESVGEADLFFRDDPENDTYGSMFVGKGGDLRSVRVPLVAIDDCIPPEIPIHVVKMDVEGSEVFALRGMRRILTDWHPTIFIELNEMAIIRAGVAEDLLAALRGFGYSVCSLNGTEYSLPVDRQRYILTDLVCGF